MDPDVQSRYHKLCDRYETAMNRLDILRPSAVPVLRAQRKLEARAGRVLRQLRDDCGPHVAALVKLAYIRSYRESVPGAIMGPEQLTEIQSLTSDLSHRLDSAEQEARFQFYEHIRRLRLGDSLRKTGVPDVMLDAINARGALALEQRARAEMAYVVDMATTAARLAATPTGDYDYGEAA